ncbi:MAG: PD-(D/E)XK nuclease family protein [Pseudomonadota bacterium]
MSAPTLTIEELFTRLAEGRAAGVTVVTPNARLARELAREFDDRQAAAGRQCWESADILPLAAFVERTWEEALYGPGGAGLPMLLTPAQERELWVEAIAASRWAGALLDVSRTAAQAMEAWRLAHAWRIAPPEAGSAGTEDARAFASWAAAYAWRARNEGLTDAATLPDLELTARGTKLLVAYAFDILPPQALAVLRRYAHAFCAPPARRSRVLRASFASVAEELESAAWWARTKLECGARRIGIVVPDLVERRRALARIFARVLRPGSELPGAAAAPMPFNVSAAEPLAAWPLAAAALGLLELAHGEVPFEAASRLLRSPFLGGAETEYAARARLDARLRRECGPRIGLAELIARSGDCPRLRAHLEAVFAIRPRGASPHDWARHFSAVLEAAGFPGERTLDSVEYQVRGKWHEVLAELAGLASVRGRLSAEEALARLRRLAAETAFQPESEDAPVQVLGLLEAAGQQFDALWVSGLTDEAWPLHARPNPFLPIALQKRAGIPESSAETSLALDARITAGWAAAADEVVFSWPRREADRDLAPSPLIAQFEEHALDIARGTRYRDAIFAQRALEAATDERAPPVGATTGVHGGTRLVADQAACPFRAFARHRLGAEALESPQPVPDARTRGLLVHALMAHIWRELKSSTALGTRELAPLVAAAAQAAVREARLEGALAQLEARRLERLAREWLELERNRDAFDVVRIEDRITIEIGGLSLTGRLDRMDRLADGTHAVIDYKTGDRASAGQWLDERPDDPQLPLYALAAGETVAALAIARIRTGEMKFSGFAAGECGIPGLRRAEDWNALVHAWRTRLDALAREFASGWAAVAPKRGLATCRDCDLQPLCRVHEKLAAFAGETEAEG